MKQGPPPEMSLLRSQPGRGKLFGSVTATQVKGRGKFGVPVDKKDVRLPPVKGLGSYPFSIKLHQGLEVTLKVGTKGLNTSSLRRFHPTASKPRRR